MSTNFHTAWTTATTLKASSLTPAIGALDDAISKGLALKGVTGLTDADATLTAAQLLSGIFTITPTVARSLTTDTAANIIAAITTHPTGTCFEFTVINLAAFDVTLVAGASVTLSGNMVVNNSSATFLALITGASTVTVYRK